MKVSCANSSIYLCCKIRDHIVYANVIGKDVTPKFQRNILLTKVYIHEHKTNKPHISVGQN